jgi:DNA-binding NtrC family response regulator
MKHILLVDDDVAVTNYFMVLLAQTGLFETTVVNDSRQVMPLLEKGDFALILLDIDMPYISGLDILNGMHTKGLKIPVIVLTGVSDVDLAVKSMKLGSFDYLVKPVDDDKLLATIDDALKHNTLQTAMGELPEILTQQQLAHTSAFAPLRTQDPEMLKVLQVAEKFAGSDLGVFIWGQNGTGKEALARAIHFAGARKEGPFVVVEATSFEPDKFPAAFFGQVRGWSDTREEIAGLLDEANGGTLFLNHIEHLNRPMQTRLLRVIQMNEYYRENSAAIRKIDVRMIAASSRDLTSAEYEETFNRDLLYRLMINSIQIPSLRERRDDIAPLAEYFLREEAERAGKSVKGITDECLDRLKQYPYPRNVRELRTIIASAVAREMGELLTIQSLPSIVAEFPGSIRDDQQRTFEPRRLNDVIAEQVKRTLQHFDGNKHKAAAELGISPEELDGILEE